MDSVTSDPSFTIWLYASFTVPVIVQISELPAISSFTLLLSAIDPEDKPATKSTCILPVADPVAVEADTVAVSRFALDFSSNVILLCESVWTVADDPHVPPGARTWPAVVDTFTVKPDPALLLY